MPDTLLALRSTFLLAGLAALGIGCSAPPSTPTDAAASDRPSVDAANRDTVPDRAPPDVDAAPDVAAPTDAAVDAPTDAATDAWTDAPAPTDAPLDAARLPDVGTPVDPLCPASYAAGLGTACATPGLLCDVSWCAPDAPTCDMLRCLGGTWIALHTTRVDASGPFVCGFPPTSCDPATSFCQQISVGPPIGHTMTQTCLPLPSHCAGVPSCECLVQYGCPSGSTPYCADPSAYAPGYAINCVSM